jgi:hypothetical protein
MLEHCICLKEYKAFQAKVLASYLSDYQPKNTEEKQKLMMDFIEKYAWLVRRIYCLEFCPHMSECELLESKRLTLDS